MFSKVPLIEKITPYGCAYAYCKNIKIFTPTALG